MPTMFVFGSGSENVALEMEFLLGAPRPSSFRLIAGGVDLGWLDPGDAHDLQLLLHARSGGKTIAYVVDDERCLTAPTDPPPSRYDDLIETCRNDGRPSGTRMRPWRAIVAQHDPEIRSRLVAALSNAGMLAVGFGEGKRALVEIERTPPQILIADIELPGVAGDLLIERARELGGATLRRAILIGAAVPEVMVPRGPGVDVVFGAPLDLDAITTYACDDAPVALKA